MRLSDFKMMHTEIPKGTQAILRFGESYELSIIQNQSSYGSKNGLFEIGVFKNGQMTEMPGITSPGDTVKGYLTENEVDLVIKKMHTITGAKPVQI